MWWKASLEALNSSSVCYVTFLVYIPYTAVRGLNKICGRCDANICQILPHVFTIEGFGNFMEILSCQNSESFVLFYAVVKNGPYPLLWNYFCFVIFSVAQSVTTEIISTCDQRNN